MSSIKAKLYYGISENQTDIDREWNVYTEMSTAVYTLTFLIFYQKYLAVRLAYNYRGLFSYLFLYSGITLAILSD